MNQKNHYSSFEGIGTHRYINIYDNIPQESFNTIIDKIMVFLNEFQNKYSRFLDTSIINILAKEGSIQNPPSELIQMLELSKKAEAQSNGYFSILVANILVDLGYGKLPNPEIDKSEYINNINKTIPQISSALKRDNNQISIEPGFRIDLGGIGKGRAIDHISQIIKSSGVKSFMVNGGGDIYAYGSNSDENNNLENKNILTSQEFEPLVYFQDPLQMDKAIGYSTTNIGGFASSSPYHRNRYKNNKKHHHLINPKTGESSESPLLGVYIYHPENAVMADIASTIIYICPPDLIDNIAKNFGVEYLLILPNYQTIMSPGFPGKLFTE